MPTEVEIEAKMYRAAVQNLALDFADQQNGDAETRRNTFRQIAHLLTEWHSDVSPSVVDEIVNDLVEQHDEMEANSGFPVLSAGKKLKES